MVANVHSQNEAGPAVISQQQLEKLLKLLPSISKATKSGSETEEEPDTTFPCLVSCYSASSDMNTCIINSGALDHMTCDLSLLFEFEETKNKPKINLLNGKIDVITHTGTVRLENNLKLQNVLCVPEFKHSLLSVNKLVQQDRCRVILDRSFCIIQDSASHIIRGIGKAQGGLHYLVNTQLKKVNNELKKLASSLAEAGKIDVNKVEVNMIAER